MYYRVWPKSDFLGNVRTRNVRRLSLYECCRCSLARSAARARLRCSDRMTSRHRFLVTRCSQALSSRSPGTPSRPSRSGGVFASRRNASWTVSSAPPPCRSRVRAWRRSGPHASRRARIKSAGRRRRRRRRLLGALPQAERVHLLAGDLAQDPQAAIAAAIPLLEGLLDALGECTQAVARCQRRLAADSAEVGVPNCQHKSSSFLRHTSRDSLLLWPARPSVYLPYLSTM